ncbi:MAG: type Z 30S ribosomal protein S14 [Candidatus Omnitrophica bacterium]|nr:type Z 30S ribosomal protein S14 [Candidatus Omnitrophota bacterium]MBU1090375.1 type Z 30S ribosomal protein S14 [Candidatus Omnitrophota bacterium]MBU1906018.1 type Z 30S ribosomal protein S14 [Candidatus Omnitrophota bacterium]
MAKNSQIARWKRVPKFSTRKHNRCCICGRSGGFLKRFMLCRICFRELAWQGMIPGVKKASW